MGLFDDLNAAELVRESKMRRDAGVSIVDDISVLLEKSESGRKLTDDEHARLIQNFTKLHKIEVDDEHEHDALISKRAILKLSSDRSWPKSRHAYLSGVGLLKR